MKKGTEWIIGAIIATVALAVINYKEQEKQRKETEETLKKLKTLDDAVESAMADFDEVVKFFDPLTDETYFATKQDFKEAYAALDKIGLDLKDLL